MQPDQLTLDMIGYIDQRMRGPLPNGIDEAGAAQILTMQQNIRKVLQSQANALQNATAPKPAEQPVKTTGGKPLPKDDPRLNQENSNGQ